MTHPLREVTERYRLGEPLSFKVGRDVVRAVDAASGAPVVVKRIVPAGPAATDAFLRAMAELAGLRHLRHPALPVLCDFGVGADGNAFLVFEDLAPDSGNSRNPRSLETLAGGPPSQILPLLAAALDGIEAVAGSGLALHNLAPDNLLLVPGEDGGERAVLLGWGTRYFRPLGEHPRGEDFAAPEARQRSLASDGRADLWSLARIACDLLAVRVDGAVAGAGSEPRLSLPLALRFELEDADGLERALAAALRGDPERRPTVAELRRGLLAALESPGAPSSAAPPVRLQFLTDQPEPAEPAAPETSASAPDPAPESDDESDDEGDSTNPVLSEHLSAWLAAGRAPLKPLDPAAPPWSAPPEPPAPPPPAPAVEPVAPAVVRLPGSLQPGLFQAVFPPVPRPHPVAIAAPPPMPAGSSEPEATFAPPEPVPPPPAPPLPAALPPLPEPPPDSLVPPAPELPLTLPQEPEVTPAAAGTVVPFPIPHSHPIHAAEEPPAAATVPVVATSRKRSLLPVALLAAGLAAVVVLGLWLSRRPAAAPTAATDPSTAPAPSSPAPAGSAAPAGAAPGSPGDVLPAALAAAREAFAAGDDGAARRALAALEPGAPGLSGTACEVYLLLDEALAAAGRERLAADLRQSLEAGDLRRLAGAVRAAGPAKGAVERDLLRLEPALREGLGQARTAVDLHARLEKAAKAGHHVRALELAAALAPLAPGSRVPAERREAAAAALEQEAERLAGSGDLGAALARLESVRQAFAGGPERPGLAERVNRLQAENRSDKGVESLLAAAEEAGARRRPDEGLAVLRGAQPTARTAGRFQELRQRLDRQLEQLDRNPPAIEIPSGELSYEKGKPAVLEIRVSDDYQVKSVTVRARPEGARAATEIAAERAGAGYRAEIPAALHQGRPVEVVVIAADTSGHTAESAPRQMRRKRWTDRLRGGRDGAGNDPGNNQ